MKRYTEKHYDENGYYLICSGNCETLNCGDCGILDKIVDRLAAYEDTGLEPEEVLPKEYAGEVMKSMILLKEYQKIGPVDRLRELVQADREGRCVVLPCKIGDIVYEIRYTAENNSPRKYARKIFDCSVSVCTWRMREQPDMCYVSEKKCTKSDFAFMGRTVFLTREEAQAALRREQDG